MLQTITDIFGPTLAETLIAIIVSPITGLIG